MVDLEPMPNRLNGNMPRSLHPFRNGVPKTEYLTKICGFSALCMFNEVQSTSAPRISELPHMQVIMTISREQLGYQLTPHSQPGCYQKSLVCLSRGDGEAIYSVSFLFLLYQLI